MSSLNTPNKALYMKKGNNKGNPTKNTENVSVPDSSSLLDINSTFKLIDLYFRQKNIMYSHLHNSFDKFIDEDVRSLLENGNNTFFEKITKDKVYRYMFKYDDIAIKPPILDTKDEMMYPSQARTRTLTYSSKLVATITQIQEVTDIATDEVTTRVIGQPEYEYPIATIPIMLRSKYCSLNIKKGHDKTECEYDPGGYFIVNGSEKVVMSLERMCDNKALVFTKKDGTSLIYTTQVNSKSYKDGEMIQIITVRMKKDKILTIRVPILAEIPVFILFRALGIESDRDIINMCIYDENDTDMINLIKESLENSVVEGTNIKIRTQEEAVEYLITKMRVVKKYSDTDKNIRAQQKKVHLETLLQDKFLPHIDNNYIHKAYYLGYMINKLLQGYLGRVPIDDRDSYVNKRIDLPGSLLFELFKQHYKKMLNECNKFFRKRNNDDDNPLNIINQIKHNIIEQGLKAALLKGVWGKKVGVSQRLERISYLQTLSSLRRISSPTVDTSTNKLTSPRHLHNTQVGCICFIETPEGGKVGLIKSLALTANVTVMMKSQLSIIEAYLKDKLIDLQDIKPGDLKKHTKIFLNGKWLGLSSNPRKLYNDLKDKKEKGELDALTSIIHEIKSEIEAKEIKIYCDGGRLYRPIFKVKNNKLQIEKKHIDTISADGAKSVTGSSTWNEFLAKNRGLVEYLDIDECINSMIGMFPTDVEKMRRKMVTSAEMIKKVKIKDNTSIINRYDDYVFVNYTHCEIHPSMMIGVVVSNIPFCNHNQAPRNIFQYSQAKQAMGIYISNYRDRLDISFILYHTQRPLITTRSMKYINTDRLPSGENTIVAIASYTGLLISSCYNKSCSKSVY